MAQKLRAVVCFSEDQGFVPSTTSVSKSLVTPSEVIPKPWALWPSALKYIDTNTHTPTYHLKLINKNCYTKQTKQMK